MQTNPVLAKMNLIRERLVKTMPCAHENADTRLGNGQVWAKCEDCGQTFEQAHWDRYRQRAKEHEEALAALDELQTLGTETWVVTAKRRSGRPDWVKTCGFAMDEHGFHQELASGATINGVYTFESEEDAQRFIDKVMTARIPQAKDYYEVRPLYTIF